MKMFKLILAVALVAIVVLAFASCGCEHSYDGVITAQPTCTDKGEQTFTCALCGNSYTEAVAAKGHTYTEKVVAPTCTEDGYTQHTCACGDTYQDTTVEAEGHTYTQTVVAPTCTVEGYTAYTCACGDTYTADTVAATGVHTYGKGLAAISDELKAAHPTALGVVGEVCTGCGATNGETGDVILVYLDFETTQTDLVGYTTEALNVNPYYKNSVTTGLIQNGKWYNTSFDQVLITDESGMHNYGEYTIAFDFLLCEQGKEDKADMIFAIGFHDDGQAAAYMFQLAVTDDGKLEFYINTKIKASATEELAGFTFEDRTAWYHIELKVNETDYSNGSVAVSIGKWTDSTLTTLEDFGLVGVASEISFQKRGDKRSLDNFRINNYNGVAALDNFIVTVAK